MKLIFVEKRMRVVTASSKQGAHENIKSGQNIVNQLNKSSGKLLTAAGVTAIKSSN